MKEAYTTVLVSIGCRGVQVLASLLVVRHLVSILGLTGYGTWVTLSAAAVWMGLFDFGIGYGIKNRISEFSATGKSSNLKELASVAIMFYAMASLLVFSVFIGIALFVYPFRDHPLTSTILFASAAASFFLSFGGIVLQGIGAFRRFYIYSLIGPVLWTGIVLFHRYAEWSLERAAIFFLVSNVLQGLTTFFVGMTEIRGISIISFSKYFQEIRPLAKVGFGFFVSQISNIVLFLSGNFIVFRSLGATDAAIYDTSNKFFQFFIIGFSILINIAWTRISQCKAKSDFHQTRKIFIGLVGFACLAGIASFGFAFVSAPIISLLTHGRIQADSMTSMLFAPLILIQTLAYAGSVFLNAYEELRIQNFFSLLSIPLFLILVQIFIYFNFRIGAIPLASALSVAPVMIYCLHRGYHLATRGKALLV